MVFESVIGVKCKLRYECGVRPTAYKSIRRRFEQLRETGIVRKENTVY